MRRTALAVAITAVLLPTQSPAADSPDWNYLEGSYLYTELDVPDASDDNFSGLEFAGTWRFHDWAYIRGSYSSQEESLNDLLKDLELDILSLGVGGIWSIHESTDLYGNINFENWDFQGFTTEADDSGYRAGVGIRSVVWRALELNAEVGYLDVGDVVDGEDYFEIGGIYTYDNGFGIGVSYEEIDDFENWRVTLRYSFR